MKKVTLVLTIFIALLLVTKLPANADIMIDLNYFFADPTVTVATDGSSALMEEDFSLSPVLLANDPYLGEPEVIFAEISGVPQILSFDFDFIEGPVGNDDEFGAFVLDSSGNSAGPAFEFFTQDTSSGTVSFDLSGLVGEPFLGLQFELSALFGDIALNSTLTISNVMLTPVPEPATMILLGTGLVGLLGFGRKKFRKTS